MLRRLLVTATLAATALAIPAAPAVAEPAAGYRSSQLALAASPLTAARATGCYRRVGNHWECITPGAFCPKAARGKYGYAKITKRRYKCSFKTSDPFWRWRR